MDLWERYGKQDVHSVMVSVVKSSIKELAVEPADIAEVFGVKGGQAFLSKEFVKIILLAIAAIRSRVPVRLGEFDVHHSMTLLFRWTWIDPSFNPDEKTHARLHGVIEIHRELGVRWIWDRRGLAAFYTEWISPQALTSLAI